MHDRKNCKNDDFNFSGRRATAPSRRCHPSDLDD